MLVSTGLQGTLELKVDRSWPCSLAAVQRTCGSGSAFWGPVGPVSVTGGSLEVTPSTFTCYLSATWALGGFYVQIQQVLEHLSEASTLIASTIIQVQKLQH